MTTASIVTYNSNVEELDTLFKCVLQSNIKHIYIVDNSPTDKLKTYANLSPKIEYIFGHGNIGYGAAHNIAIKKAIEINAKYHVVINPDIYFEDGTIEGLTNYMEENKSVGQVMPKVFFPNGEIQYVCKMIPTPIDLIFKRFLPSKFTVKRTNKFQLKFTSYTKPMNVPYLSGCFMFFRVEAFSKVGLFDERFFMYPEDIDITRRMHAKYKTMYNPSITIIHAHAAESKTNKKMLVIHIINMIKYFNKWGWVFDKQRRQTNRKLLHDLAYNKQNN